MPNTIKFLDPVQGLIDYVNDIKPYHTKIIESLVEYVSTEFVNVTILEDFQLHIEFDFSYDINIAGCAGGYGALPFDDPENFPILSPDPSKMITDVQTPPVFTSNSFIVLEDRTQGLDPAGSLTFKMISFIEDQIIGIVDDAASPSIGGEFHLRGDRSSTFVDGFIFSVSGSLFNDTSYKVTADSTYNNINNITKIPVDGQIKDANDVSGFIKISDATGSPPINNNNGSFTVISSTFTPGTVDISPYTTTVISGLTLVPPVGLDHHQRYVSSVTVGNLEYKKILTYSNVLKYHNSSPDSLIQTPDEGDVIAPIISLSETSPSFFEIEGDFENSNLFIGDEIIVVDSNPPDKYTITSMITNINASPPVTTTTFGVDPPVHDVVVDDEIKLNIPSNIFVLDDDYTRFFKQGRRITAFTGNKTGNYTTLNSKFVNGETQIRVRESLIHDDGPLIIGISGSPPGLIVDGDVSSTYKEDKQFNIIKSIKNTGFYTTASDSSYDGLTNLTTIPVVEPFDSSDVTGEIHEFVKGVLNYRSVGFGQTPELCEVVPETVVSVSIREELHINNLGIWTFDDIIAHGLHDEGWGFDLPPTTIFATGSPLDLPDILISDIAPPSFPDALWFDTSPNSGSPYGPGILKEYVQVLVGSPPDIGGSPGTFTWVDIPGNKIYAVADNNTMYYRIIYQYYDNAGSPAIGYTDPIINGSPPTGGIDTGWILEFTKTPGYNDHLTGNGTREQQNVETFFATETSTSEAGTIFDLVLSSIPEIEITTGSPPVFGSPPTLQPNPLMLEVYVNSVIAEVNILSTTSFDIISPRLRIDDFIEARVFDDTATPSGVWVGSYDANAAIVETFDMLLGYKFHIDGTNSDAGAGTGTIHIPDVATGSPPEWNVYNIFTGSPVDTIIEIIGSEGSPGINDGIYTINNVSQEGSPINHVVLTVNEVLSDTGIFSGSPAIGSGKALYQQWFQYFITNTTTNTITVNGDATGDIVNTTIIKIINSSNNGTYTVTGTTYDGRNTTITINVSTLTPGNTGGWVESI